MMVIMNNENESLDNLLSELFSRVMSLNKEDNLETKIFNLEDINGDLISFLNIIHNVHGEEFDRYNVKIKQILPALEEFIAHLTEIKNNTTEQILHMNSAEQLNKIYQDS